MLIKRPADIRPSEITEEKIYRERRQFMRQAMKLASLLRMQGGQAAEEGAHVIQKIRRHH